MMIRTPEFLKSLKLVLVGLVDTAVKTAETGYMQRRLVKVSCLFPLKILEGGGGVNMRPLLAWRDDS